VGAKAWTPEEMEAVNVELAMKHMHEITGKDGIEISNQSGFGGNHTFYVTNKK
jgi:hypothetical protein